MGTFFLNAWSVTFYKCPGYVFAYYFFGNKLINSFDEDQISGVHINHTILFDGFLSPFPKKFTHNLLFISMNYLSLHFSIYALNNIVITLLPK